KAQVVGVVVGLARTRWLMYEQRTTAISPPLLVVVVLWLTLILTSFGLYAPANATVVASLAISALAVSGAIFLILEMYAPYSGGTRVSSAPWVAALAHLGQEVAPSPDDRYFRGGGCDADSAMGQPGDRTARSRGHRRGLRHARAAAAASDGAETRRLQALRRP